MLLSRVVKGPNSAKDTFGYICKSMVSIMPSDTDVEVKGVRQRVTPSGEDVIKASVPKDCLVMRYGGDEFVVFGSCTNAKRMQMIVSKIKNTMEKENQNEKRIYQLSASIGCSVHASDEIDDLNQLIESADKRMYEEKKEKHMRR